MLPGQTKTLDPKAADTEALITFYSSLREQKPESEMAARFCVQHGLLEEDEAAELCKKFAINKKGGSASKPKPKPKKVRRAPAPRDLQTTLSNPPVAR